MIARGMIQTPRGNTQNKPSWGNEEIIPIVRSYRVKQ
jgi:hypothetical protein